MTQESREIEVKKKKRTWLFCCRLGSKAILYVVDWQEKGGHQVLMMKERRRFVMRKKKEVILLVVVLQKLSVVLVTMSLLKNVK